jgi:hypothetical protein
MTPDGTLEGQEPAAKAEHVPAELAEAIPVITRLNVKVKKVRREKRFMSGGSS